VAVIYHGPAKVSQLLADLQLLDASSSALLQAALPLGGRNIIRWFSPDPLRIAEAYAEGDYLDEAAAELHKLLNTTTDSTADRAAANRLEAWQLLAQIAQRRGDAKAELTARQTLAESAPEKSEYALQWALALARHGQTARARDILQSLEADAAESADQLALLGQAYLQMGQFAPSIGLFERALALQPERADHRFGLAMALQAAGQPERAMQSYRQLLSQQPQLHAAANNLAWLLATQPTSDDVSGQQEAVELAARICQETGNTNSSYLDTLSMALAARGDWPRAEQTLRTAIDVARSRGETEMVQKLRRRLADFQQRRRGA
jgi:tetratricopeptide (TPR) repeat protein